MEKNSFKLKKKSSLPFFETVQKEDSLFTTLPSLKNLSYFGNWGSIFPKPSVFFSNYRVRAKSSLTTNWKQLKKKQFVILLFPFIFSFSLLIRSRYKEQLFSYFVKDSLPGFCLPRQNLSWETFREITSEKLAYLSDDKRYSYKVSKTCASGSESTFNNVNMLEDNGRILKTDFPINCFVSKVDIQEKQTNLQNQDLIKRLDIYSNLILLEMKFALEQKQKQLYIGFLPKEKKITLNKLPAQNRQLTLFNYGQNTAFSSVKDNYKKQKVAVKTFNHGCPEGTNCSPEGNHGCTLSLQKKNNKSKTLSDYKFYARRPNFLSFYKGVIELKRTHVNIKPTIINVFSKQLFQQKLFDLDELPSKLDQSYSEVLFSKSTENKTYLNIPGPKLFEKSKIFQNRKFVSNLLDFSSNQGKDISNVENSITSQKFESNLLNSLSSVPLFPIGKPIKTMEQIGKENSNDKTPVVNKLVSKKSLIENELKNFFYDEGFIPFKNLQKYTNQLADLDLTSSFVIPDFRRFVNFISDFYNQEKNMNDVEEFDFFDSIQTLIFNLEKNNSNLTLPQQTFITQSRLLSGYFYPDMEVAKIRSLLIQNVYKNFPYFLQKLRFYFNGRIYLYERSIGTIFKKLKTPINILIGFPIKIEFPSSFIDDLLTESDYLVSTSLEPSALEPLKQSKPVFSFLTNLQVKFHYLPASQTLLNQNLPENLNVGGIYQNTFTIYKNSKTEKNYLHTNFDRNLQFIKKDANNSLPSSETFFRKKSKQNNVFSSNLKPVKRLLSFFKPFLYFQNPFRESWEPVTVQSWLVITKLSFVFIALKIFQSFLLNYGKYLLFLSFLDENLKEKLGLTENKKDKGYRLVKTVKKRFKDIAGIDNILPELGEMVWVLRNSGRSFKVGNPLPKGFLFVGPPGTGKTLLVQAIAGEAEVPVLVQSGSSFISNISITDAEENETGAQRLKNLFEQARKMAPCILFIDEMDTLGESRQNVMRNSVETDDLIQSLHHSNQDLPEKSSINIGKPGSLTEKQSRGGVNRNENLQHASYIKDRNDSTDMLKGDVSDVRKKNEAKQKANQEQLTLLMQFLIELDGLKSRTGVLVIGATNRPKVLDPALTRPGRFDRVLNLEFPGKRKRIEILKLYSQNIGLTLSSPTIVGEVGDALTSNKNEVFVKSEVRKTKGNKKAPVKASQSLRSDISTSYTLKSTTLKGTDYTFNLKNRNPFNINSPYFFRTSKMVRKKIKRSIKSVFTSTNEKKQPNISTNFSVTNLPYFASNKNEVFVRSKGRILGITKDRSNSLKKINENPDFPWEYLANRTFGFSAADLAAAMNQSALQAILQNTGHTIETIDQGIEVITSYNVEKPKIDNEKQKDPFFITRFAYFQAGKAVLHTLLPQHPDGILLNLWPRPKNNRHKNGNLQLTSINHRTKLETHLIGLYAGKAAELLPLCLNSHIFNAPKDNISKKFKPTTNSKIKEKTLPNSKSISVGNTFRKGYASSNKNQVLDLLANPFKIGDFNRYGFFQRLKTKQKRSFCTSNITKGYVKARAKQELRSCRVSPLLYGFAEDSNFSHYDKRYLSHSSLGITDLSVASKLAHSLVDKWHFYSNKVVIRRENQIFINQNQLETSEIEVFDLFQQLTEDIQNKVSTSNISESSVGEHSRYNFQELSIRPWWQNQITKQTENLNMFYDDWYRIYLSDPEESARNEEWVTPDEYYHNTQNLKTLLPISYFYSFNPYPYFASNKNGVNGVRSMRKKDKRNSYLLPTFKDLTNSKFLPSFFSDLDTKDWKQKNHILTVQQKDEKFEDKNLTVQPNLFPAKPFGSLVKQKNYHFVRSSGTHLIYTNEQPSKILKENSQLFVKDLIFKNPFNIYKNCQTKEKLFFDITWNDLYKLDRDYIYHALVLTCFNKAFSLLDENRELLDYLSDYLMRFETLQQQKIEEIFYDFAHFSIENKSFLNNQQTLFASKKESQPSLLRDQLKILKDKQKISFIFDKKWGKNSRRDFSRFFSFNQQRLHTFFPKKANKKIYARPFTFLKPLLNKN